MNSDEGVKPASIDLVGQGSNLKSVTVAGEAESLKMKHSGLSISSSGVEVAHIIIRPILTEWKRLSGRKIWFES